MFQGSKPGQAAQNAADIIRDAGGKVVGRTRLQKIAYLLELAQAGSGFPFAYRHYGPYSEELANAVRVARRLGLAAEEERETNWGGSYSVFTTQLPDADSAPIGRLELIRLAVEADPVELELAATAAFLFAEGERDPWGETQRRKPEKASNHLDAARALYKKLRSARTPQPLPELS
jgi:hypothetical protein